MPEVSSIVIREQMPELAGLFMGGCVARGEGSSFRARAHAHTALDDPWRGWVCVRAPRRVFTPSGKPSTLMWHEYAHITVGSRHGHDQVWRERITEYGFPAEAKRYIKKKRPPLTWYWFDRETGERLSGTHREMVAALRGRSGGTAF